MREKTKIKRLPFRTLHCLLHCHTRYISQLCKFILDYQKQGLRGYHHPQRMQIFKNFFFIQVFLRAVNFYFIAKLVGNFISLLN